MYLSIIILPLFGSIVSGFFGRKVGISGGQFVAVLAIMVTTILVLIAFVETGFSSFSVFISLFRWIDSEWFNFSWGFQFDSLTVSMLIPVLIISLLVHIYSLSYMDSDPHNQRFFSYLSLFTFMMVILVTANNYLLMFVGWEGVGVCSFLLVSFWFTRIAANQSSMSAFLTNRVGDCFLTIGMFAILWSIGNLDYATIFSLISYINKYMITIMGICLLIGAMAKSSQVGLHIWLPMAMEGPTPVSALIHAATMVTAGVYLLMRSSPLVEYSSILLLLCLWLGAITTIFSSLIGLFQQDIKKVIAYSTMSQLGMMVIAIGLSSYNIALFHLINHAFYKGLLFLGAGSVIHAVVDNQDFRKYGGLINYLPLTYSVIFIASLSLMAFPFMTGFYSKDFILESAYGKYSFASIAVYVIATIGAIFTTLYSVKVLYLTFLANPNGSKQYYKHAHEGNIYLTLPLIVLALFSIFFGFITKDIFIGLGSSFFTDNSLFIHPLHEILINTEFGVSIIFKLLPLFFTIAFTVLAFIIYEYISEWIFSFKFSKLGYDIFGFFNQRFLIEMFYNNYIVTLVLNLGKQTTNILDKGSVEMIGPAGLEKSLINISKKINNLSSGNPVNYALFLVVALLLITCHLIIDIDLSLLILLGFNIFYLVYDFNIHPTTNNLESSFILGIRCFSSTRTNNRVPAPDRDRDRDLERDLEAALEAAAEVAAEMRAESDIVTMNTEEEAAEIAGWTEEQRNAATEFVNSDYVENAVLAANPTLTRDDWRIMTNREPDNWDEHLWRSSQSPQEQELQVQESPQAQESQAQESQVHVESQVESEIQPQVEQNMAEVKQEQIEQNTEIAQDKDTISEKNVDLVDNNKTVNPVSETKVESIGDEQGESSKSGNKRSFSEVEGNSDEEEPSKRIKESPIDYVLEKQSTEMPDIIDSDGGD